MTTMTQQKVLYTAKHTPRAAVRVNLAALMTGWLSSCRCLARPGTAPIRSSCSPPAGRRASKVRWRAWLAT